MRCYSLCNYLQESDKLKDDDLYKFLLDLKRPAALKRLKCIRGTLKLDISVAPEQTKYCFTPELTKLIPFPGDHGWKPLFLLHFL